jgi:hypothetical protein
MKVEKEKLDPAPQKLLRLKPISLNSMKIKTTGKRDPKTPILAGQTSF